MTSIFRQNASTAKAAEVQAALWLQQLNSETLFIQLVAALMHSDDCKEMAGGRGGGGTGRGGGRSSARHFVLEVDCEERLWSSGRIQEVLHVDKF